jgi:GAF domain-containing protein
LDVGADEVFFDNPDLPGTRSEMALPLRVRDEIIGVLDVQSSEPAAFSDEDVAVLMAMADQLAVAVSNAQLFQQAQDSLEAQRRAYGAASREAWAGLLRAETDLSVVRDERGISAADAPWQPHMETALRAGRIVPSFDGASSLAIPLKIRGQVLGVIEAQKPEGTGHWAREEVEILETLVERLGVTLESARLFQETQRRAARDRLLGEVTARVRETLDMDSVLQTAVREIGLALNLAEVEVRMGEIMTSRQTAAPASTGGNGHEENEGVRP